MDTLDTIKIVPKQTELVVELQYATKIVLTAEKYMSTQR